MKWQSTRPHLYLYNLYFLRFHNYCDSSQKLIFSIIIMRKGTKVFRESTTFSSPQSYVTIEIRNKTIKKKLSHHRSSVLNQLYATQSILNDSLTKCTPHVKSAFLTPKASGFCLKKQLKTSTLSSLLKAKEKKLKQNRRNEGNFQSKYRVCKQIKSKLRQITNISHHFEQACSHKTKKLKTEACDISDNYLLPSLDQHKIGTQTPIVVPDVKLNKDWLKKIRNGRSLAEKLKQRLSNVKLSLPLRQKLDQEYRVDYQRKLMGEHNQNQNESDAHSSKRKSLKDIYFTRLERKTAPMSTTNRNNTFYKMFCNHQSIEPTLRDHIKVENEDVRKLQEFVTGNESSEFKEYDDLINIKGFLRDRQNFNVLKKMYNHVKQKYQFDFKQMNLDSIKETNLLALVYYLQNQSNMTELEKKNWKAKMKLLE